MKTKELAELLRRAEGHIGDLRAEIDGEAGWSELEKELERAACTIQGEPVPSWAEEWKP